MEEWIKVDGYENLPIGFWLVRLEEEQFGTIIHVAACYENLCIIGGSFGFDIPKVMEYRSIPE